MIGANGGNGALSRQPGRDADRAVPDRAIPDRAGLDHRPARRAPRPDAETAADVLLAALEERVDPTEVDRYFGVGGVRVERRDDRRVRVLGSSGFLTRLVEKRFGAVLHEAAERTFGAGVEVEYAVDPAADALKPSDLQATSVRGTADTGPVARSADPEPDLDPGATLDKFCVGPTNRLAYAAALRLAEQPESFGGPLFIHGPCGVGKTHLLQGVARRLAERGVPTGAGATRAARVRYVNAEDFVGEFTQAIRKNATDRFRAKYRKLDLLCVDDVHLIAGKPATQQELVQTINATELASGRLALASDSHPRQLGHTSDALVSRFMAGMVVKVDLPDTSLARQLIAKIATRRSVPMQPAAVERIAEYAARAAAGNRSGAAAHAPGSAHAACCSVRELEGMVLKVEAVWRLLPELSGSPVGVLAVERALGEDRADAPMGATRRPPRGDEVVAAACRVLGVSASEFMGRGRHKRVVLARSIAATLCRRFTTLSYPEIARAMGRPNHSTIITACQRLSRQLEGAEPSGLDGELAGVSIARLIELADEETRRIAFGDRQAGAAMAGNR